MLSISRYIIHEVHKEAKVVGATLELSDSVPPISDFAKALIQDSHKSFGDSTALKNTRFEEGHSTVFLTGLGEYLSLETSDQFYKFTVDALGDLKSKIENEQFATGGYYLFADYHYDARRFISAVLLRKKSGVNFKRENGVIVPVDGENINVEKIAMGFRLNHGMYLSEEDERNYIALVTNQQEKLSGYFKKWVQAAGIISNDKNTRSLVRILNAAPIPKREDGTDKYESREEMKKACYDNIEQSGDKTVNLFTLSEHLYGADKKNELQDFAQQHEITIDPEFKRSSQILKQLITIRAKVDGIELNVDYNKLTANVVDVQEETIIIHSKSLVDQIKQQKNE